MVEERRSPKRARTDNAPPDADAIAQTNSTLQVFLGQNNRQNRWMAGYVPPGTTNGDAGVASSAKASRAGNVQSANIAGGVQPPNSEGTIQHVDSAALGGLRHGSNGIVQYESPTTAHPNANNIAASHTVPNHTYEAARRISTAMAHLQHSLPSPATSDDNVASPLMNRASNQTQRPGNVPLQPMPAPKRRGRPPSADHGHHVFRTGSPANSAQPVQTTRRHKSRSSSGSVSIPIVPSMPQQGAAVPTGAYGQPASMTPPNPAFYSPQLAQDGAVDSMLSLPAMRERFKTFQPTQRLNGVDSGRLTLLREAINANDLFYIALSQIHALTKTPDLIPNSAQGLDPKCITYLNTLICSPDQMSPIVRAPIVKIYSSSVSAPIYDLVVKQVTAFLRLLPVHWDRIVTESKSRETPPLVEDFVDVLQLHSPTFQKTAFRAICRGILQPDQFSYPEKGIDRLEHLHLLDQMWFAQHERRGPADKSLAYRAFLITKVAWKEHEPKLRVFERLRLPNNEQQQQQPPQFTFPAQAYAAFQYPPGTTLNYSPNVGNTMLVVSAAQRQLSTSNASGSSPRILSPNSAFQEFRQLPARMQQTLNNPTPQQVPPGRIFVFPREGEQPRAQPTNPDPLRSALHQAHLRSPTLGSIPTPPEVNGSSLYRYVDGYALTPQWLPKEVPIQHYTFLEPPARFEHIPASVPSRTAGEPPSRVLTEHSFLYRLRCAAGPQDGFSSESAWVVADNVWPENLFLKFNGTILEPRRKLHHGRYLPIDLTGLIKPGENTVEALVNRTSTDPRPFDYLIAVEIIGVRSHESIKKDIRTISRETTLQAIQESLASRNDNDELAVTSSNLTIRLFDPYSNSKIFDIPVRGATCAHKDCFDLETFLNMCKRDKPGWPSVVDCWRCPLCRGDVRPQTLVMDGFLADVRRELGSKGLLNTRAIVVEADGSWTPKAEERTGVRSPSLDREERSGSERVRGASASAAKKVVEVIELD